MTVHPLDGQTAPPPQVSVAKSRTARAFELLVQVLAFLIVGFIGVIVLGWLAGVAVDVWNGVIS
jgi:hypothetical protein